MAPRQRVCHSVANARLISRLMSPPSRERCAITACKPCLPPTGVTLCLAKKEKRKKKKEETGSRWEKQQLEGEKGVIRMQHE